MLGVGSTIAIAAALLLGVYGTSREASSEVVAVDWPDGLGSGAAAEMLASLDLTSSPRTLAAFFDATGGAGSFIPGPHLLERGWSAWQIRRALERSSRRAMVKVVIPEGYHLYGVAKRLEQQRILSEEAFIRASTDPALLRDVGVIPPGESAIRSAEGYLFPATYDLYVDTHPADILRRMVDESTRRWRRLEVAHAASVARLKSDLGWGRHEILTLASIVEKEAVVDAERPLIASVFLNRLTDPSFPSRRLQSDPTAMYGCVATPELAPSCAGFQGKATPAINRDPANPYSTYTHAALPPGPIANPGARSVEAVLEPAKTGYFYFVASGKGRHTFSRDYAAHNQAIKQGTASSP